MKIKLFNIGGKVKPLAREFKSKYTSRDMVQDGLLLALEAIENDGVGVHNPNVTTVKSLVGDFSLNMGVKPTDIAFELTTQISGIKLIDEMRYWELVFYPNLKESGAVRPLHFCGSNYNYGFGCKVDNAQDYYRRLMYCAGPGNINSTDVFIEDILRKSDEVIVKNGGSTAARNLRFAGNYTGAYSLVGICSLYLYDHILSDEEFAKNLAVYEKRYGSFGRIV